MVLPIVPMAVMKKTVKVIPVRQIGPVVRNSIQIRQCQLAGISKKLAYRFN